VAQRTQRIDANRLDVTKANVLSEIIFGNYPFLTGNQRFLDVLPYFVDVLPYFVDQFTSLRFTRERSEILSAPKGINFSRDDLLAVFKRTNSLLSKEGLRGGYERFSVFGEILFLKLVDESERLSEKYRQSIAFFVVESFAGTDRLRVLSAAGLRDEI